VDSKDVSPQVHLLRHFRGRVKCVYAMDVNPSCDTRRLDHVAFWLITRRQWPRPRRLRLHHCGVRRRACAMALTQPGARRFCGPFLQQKCSTRAM